MPVMPIKTGDAFMREVASVVRNHVGNAIRPIAAQNAALIQQNAVLIQRVEHLEKQYSEITPPEAGPPGKPGEPGKDGTSVSPDDVLPALLLQVESLHNKTAAELRQMILDLPKPADGKPGKDGNDGAPGLDGKDGANVVSALIDRNGNLILNLSNGQGINVGVVIGKDGAPGPPGRDGLGIDNLEVVQVDERTFVVRFSSGEVSKEFPLKFQYPIYRGIWKQAKYEKADLVTYDGSMFHANADTEAQPAASKEWQLAAKRGHHGKDGEPGLPGKQGKPGRDGRDLTQLGPDGSKW